MSRATASAGILSDRIRRIVIEQSKRANVGHIGSSLSVADILGTLYAGVLQGRRAGRSRARSLRALEGTRKPGAVRGAARDGRDRLRGARELLRRRQPPRNASRSRPARRGLLDGLARPRALAGDGLGARRAALGQRTAHVRAHERRRVQRGLGLGGGHVRRAPPARRTSWSSSTSTASRRSATRAT